MNHHRRRMLVDAADKLDTINQLLPQAQDIVSEALSAEKEYRDNMPAPLQNSRKAVEAERVIKELTAVFEAIGRISLLPAAHALVLAVQEPTEADWGERREGVSISDVQNDVRTAAEAALEALAKGGPKGRDEARRMLETVLH